jgi:hypothetical protein
LKPKIFVGSSSEALPLAYAIQENLEQAADVTVWTQDIFKPSRYSLESLEMALDAHEYGIFVFTPDDLTLFRTHNYRTVRDNIIFEFGLFVGRLGKEHCFFIAPRSSDDMHLPSDLAGLNSLTYEPNRIDNLVAALGPACNQIRRDLSSSNADSVSVARNQYDLLLHKYPSRRTLRYLDAACIFNNRTMFDSCVGYPQLFVGATRIRALGISLNAITISWGIKNLVRLVERGCDISLLFLDPSGKASRLREDMENLPVGTIANVTKTNLAIVRSARNTVIANADLLKYRVYEATPSLNMYAIDDSLVIFQHYLAGTRGQECPVFVARNEDKQDALYETYSEAFDRIWQSATLIED